MEFEEKKSKLLHFLCIQKLQPAGACNSNVFEVLAEIFDKTEQEVRQTALDTMLCNFEGFETYFRAKDLEAYKSEVLNSFQDGNLHLHVILEAVGFAYSIHFKLYQFPRQLSFFPTTEKFQDSISFVTWDGMSIQLLRRIEDDQVDETFSVDAQNQMSGLEAKVPSVESDNHEMMEQDEDYLLQPLYEEQTESEVAAMSGASSQTSGMIASDRKSDRELPSEHEIIDEDDSNEEDLFEPNDYHKGVRSQKARAMIKVYILFQGQYDCLTAAEVIKNEKPTRMYIAAFIHSTDCNLLERDYQFCTDFTIYSLSLPIATYHKERSIRRLFGKMMVPWLLLSAARFHWNEIEVLTLCRYNKRSILNQVMEKYWQEIERDVEVAVLTMIANPESSICLTCSKQCGNWNKCYHLNLHLFVRANLALGDFVLFSQNVNLFEAEEINGSPLMSAIKNFYLARSPVQTILQNVHEIISSIQEGKKYYTYLVVIFNGPNMHRYRRSSFGQLWRNAELYRCMYAGCTTGQDFRYGHFFTEGSGIYKLLCRDARVFLVRSAAFADWHAAAQDEAMTIQILKTKFNHQRANFGPQEYLIINQRSELSLLYTLTEEDMEVVTNFCKSGVPIIKEHNINLENFHQGNFIGNYTAIKEITKPEGHFENIPFEDVENEYLKLIQRTPI